MDLYKLHKIDENLTSDDVAQLKFLCMDIISRKRLESVIDAKDLFQRLDEQGLLEDGLLVPELLVTMSYFELLSVLGTNREQVENDLLERDATSGNKVISDYRKMLFRLSVDMTDENLHAVLFLLDLPKSKFGKTPVSFLEVMIELEKQQRLGEDNLDELQRVLEGCDKTLAKKIEDFKNMQREEEQERRNSIENVTTDSEPEPLKTNEQYYIIKNNPVGYCLIINNYNFTKTSKLQTRNGTNKDRDELQKVFQKMHFQVIIEEDLSASDIHIVLKDFANRNHSKMDVFVCCVLSHGDRGMVKGVDGNCVPIREVTKPFAECQSLANKPKLFFIQACQGNVAQKGVLVADGPKTDTYEADAQALNKIPLEADFLVGMATIEDYFSYRHTKQGSIYIQELCRQLEILCPRNEDILSILTNVNREVSTRNLSGFKQMPEPRYTLRKKLVLPMTESPGCL